jgi:hypothetical protein
MRYLISFIMTSGFCMLLLGALLILLRDLTARDFFSAPRFSERDPFGNRLGRKGGARG